MAEGNIGNSLLGAAISYGSQAATFVSGLGLGRNASKNIKSQFVDVGECLTGLAFLVFRDKKTKISVREHEIHRDHYYSGVNVQGGKRFLYGGSHEDLHNLAAPLFYAVKWLNPSENKKISLVFELALEGIQQLIEVAYLDDFQTRQYLHCCHLKILEKGIKGEKMEASDFLIPSWEDNPLATASKEFWTSEESPLETICDMFKKAVDRKEKNQEFLHQIEAIKEETRTANQQIKTLYEKIRSGQQIRLFQEIIVHSIIII